MRVRRLSAAPSTGRFALWRARCNLTPERFQAGYRELEEVLTYQLRHRVRDADNQRSLNGLGTQHDRGNLFRLLTPRESNQPTTGPNAFSDPRFRTQGVPLLQDSNRSKCVCGFAGLAQTAVKNGSASLTSAFRSVFSSTVSDARRH